MLKKVVEKNTYQYYLSQIMRNLGKLTCEDTYIHLLTRHVRFLTKCTITHNALNPILRDI